MCDATSAQPTVTLREFAQHEYMGAPLTEMVHVLEDTGGLLKGDSFERKPQRIDSRPICVPAMGKFGELLAFLCVNKKKAACAKAASKVPLLALFGPSHFMTPTTLLAQLEPAVDQLLDGFRLEDIKPRMLPQGGTLCGVLRPEERGETASWDDWRDHFQAVALQQREALNATGNSLDDEVADEWRKDYREARRIFGLLSLPEEILQATHKMLFAEVTATPSWVAPQAMTEALFTHDWDWNGVHSEVWRLYRKAE